MTPNQIQVVVLDMDDTLLRSDGSLSNRTQNALNCWRSGGGHLIIATGRPPRAVAKSLPPELHDVPFICYNGADVRLQEQVIHADLIPAEDARQVLATHRRPAADYTVGLEIDDRLYLNRAPDRFKRFELVDDLLDVATGPAAKIFFVPVSRDVDLDQDERLFKTVTTDLPASIRPMHSTRYRLLQLMSRTADKAEALQVVLSRWGLGFEHAVAFGDDVNDVEMIRQSGMGVAVANAVPEVQAVADRITFSNDEDGVAVIVEELMRA